MRERTTTSISKYLNSISYRSTNNLYLLLVYTFMLTSLYGILLCMRRVYLLLLAHTIFLLFDPTINQFSHRAIRRGRNHALR